MRNPTKYCNINYKNKKHIYFIVLLFKAGWVTMFRGKKIADIDALNYWLETKNDFKRPLILLKRKELIKTLLKFEKEVVREKFIKELINF
jgi:hypothetical protein